MVFCGMFLSRKFSLFNRVQKSAFIINISSNIFPHVPNKMIHSHVRCFSSSMNREVFVPRFINLRNLSKLFKINANQLLHQQLGKKFKKRVWVRYGENVFAFQSMSKVVVPHEIAGHIGKEEGIKVVFY